MPWVLSLPVHVMGALDLQAPEYPKGWVSRRHSHPRAPLSSPITLAEEQLQSREDSRVPDWKMQGPTDSAKTGGDQGGRCRGQLQEWEGRGGQKGEGRQGNNNG